MKNRVPSPGQAGRVLVTPEDGGSPFYATIAMADNPTENGTPWSMESVLQDATAALFGLGADAVPDDLFAYLGKYEQHWWRRKNKSYSVVKTKKNSPRYIISSSSRPYSITVGDAVDINLINGAISIRDAKRISIASATDAKSSLNGKYYYHSNYGIDETGTVFFSDEGTTYTDLQYGVQATNYYTVSTKEGIGEWEYLQSSDRSAYPNSGIQDGYEYEYLGIPFDNAVGAPKIETGSYVGTGTHGQSNQNSLTFGFAPKFVFIQSDTDTGYNDPARPTIGIYIANTKSFLSYTPNTSGGNRVTANNNTITWYSTDAGYQLNAEAQYRYLAIG